MSRGKATPILRIFDETKAREFYDSRLGRMALATWAQAATSWE
jgi:hypothetical protein